MHTPQPWDAIAARGNLALLLIRHGRTAWNDQGRFLGRTDIGLDALGREQARALSTGLGTDLAEVISSPLCRAAQTAAELHDAPTLVDGLRELDQGALEGLRLKEAMAQFPSFFREWAEDPGSVTPPEGENLGACQERVLEALDGLAAAHRGGQVIAAVSHQLAIASALCGLTGSPLARWRDHRLENCGISVLEFDGQTWKIREHGRVVGNLGTVAGSNLPDV